MSPDVTGEAMRILREGLATVAAPLTEDDRSFNWTPRAQRMMVEWFQEALDRVESGGSLPGRYVHIGRWLDHEGVNEGRRFDACVAIQLRLMDLRGKSDPGTSEPGGGAVQAPSPVAQGVSALDCLRLVSGLDLFLVRPSAYPEEGPKYQRMCMGLLWLPGLMAHVGLLASMAQLWIRYFGKGEPKVGPFAYASAAALVAFWGAIATAMLLFRLRRPRGKQWQQFTQDVWVWAPWPGIISQVVLYGVFLLGTTMLWRSEAATKTPDLPKAVASRERSRTEGRVMPEHAVIVTIAFSGSDLDPVAELEDKLMEAINSAGRGEFDGNEVGEGNCVLYLYGPDADALFAVVEPVLRASSLCRGAQVVLRYGRADDPKVKEKRVTL